MRQTNSMDLSFLPPSLVCKNQEKIGGDGTEEAVDEFIDLEFLSVKLAQLPVILLARRNSPTNYF